MNRIFVAVLALLLSVQMVHASAVTKGARDIYEACIKKWGKEVAELGGERAIQKVLENASREGGDALVAKVIQYGKKYGPSAVKAIDNSPALYVKALDQLPEGLAERALWAAQRDPVVVTSLLSLHGPDALRVVAKYPGVGADIVTKLGDDGVRMAKDITEEQSITLARHADEIAGLPLSQRSRVVDKIASAPDRAIGYLEKHPRVLYTAAGIATFLALKDDIIGGPDKPGLIERLIALISAAIDKGIANFHTPLVVILLVIATTIGGWGSVKIWGAYRRERIRVANAEKAHQVEHSEPENVEK